MIERRSSRRLRDVSGAWGAVPARLIGQPLTKVIYDILKADLEYLHGDAGQIALNNAMRLTGTGGAAELELFNPTPNKAIDFYLADDGIARFRFSAILDNILNLDSTGRVSVNGLRVHRHPYSSDRHIESGQNTWPAIGPGSISVVFTDAYASTPQVIVGSQNNGDHGYATSIGTTGFTLGQSSGGTQIVGWISDGAD